MRIIPGILCGGSGTRLWPVSRSRSPKQLQKLIGERSLLADTVHRLVSHQDCEPPILICGAAYADEIEHQMLTEQVPLSALLVEPMGRDTAAASAVAAHWTMQKGRELGEETVLLLLPADHHIGNIEAFHAAISEASRSALNGLISTLGIVPDAPETGFGYIRRTTEKLDGLESYMVAEFVEKPPLEKAKEYLASGQYAWNSGMFAFEPTTFLNELQAFEPEIAAKAEHAFQTSIRRKDSGRPERVAFRKDDFEEIPKKSIDFAVMEHTQKACMVPADIDWSDVGSWSALHEIGEKDADGNVSEGHVVLHDTQNCLIRGSGERVVATIGLRNVAVIDTADAVLVCPLDQVQDVKRIHTHLKDTDHPAAEDHPSKPLSTLAVAQTWAEDWLSQKALPLWAERGADTEYGGVFEALDLNGDPLTDLTKRTRVQARQAYVFSHAAMLGYQGCEEAMQVPLQFMLDKAYLGEGRFAHKLNRDGSVLDDQVDTYDLAFILFALAYVYNVTGEARYKTIAFETLTFLRTELAHPDGGFVEALPNPDRPRRANPHMHLLEAALAWMELHESEEMKSLADDIATLFETRFRVAGLLREHFSDDLKSLPENVPAELLALEPGHLCEWSYLLDNYTRQTGRKLETKATMNAFVEAYGRSSHTGLQLDLIGAHGYPLLNPTSRLWPQTEYMRWKLTVGGEHNDSKAMDMLARIRKYYLTFDKQETGFWKDTLTSQGELIATTSPTSSFYHIMTGLATLLKR